MQLHDIENLSVEELKGRKAELIAEAAKAPPAELAARYVQARLDAKARDATLAEQGRTIATLNATLEKERQERADERQAAQQERQQLHGQLTKAQSQIEAHAQELVAVNVRCGDALQRAETAEQLARARRTAVAEIQAIAGRALIDG